MLSGLGLSNNALVFDPWNGSGTTTSACTKLGLPSWGIDLNPAMVVVAKARLLPPSEADSLFPLCQKLLERARPWKSADEPLSAWFDHATASRIRGLEVSIRNHLVGGLSSAEAVESLAHLSTLAAAFYTALFAVCRQAIQSYRTANPTWIKRGNANCGHVHIEWHSIKSSFLNLVKQMANELGNIERSAFQAFCPSLLQRADTSAQALKPQSVDVILTSPPYCTRLDYVASTRVEIAIVSPWLEINASDLARQMLGTVAVPRSAPEIDFKWGAQCLNFLDKVRCHTSKASAGYYFKNHVDYYNKLYSSIVNIENALKIGAPAVFVVQDSYYKDVHNPLPDILIDMAMSRGLSLVKRSDFRSSRSLASINAGSRLYRPGMSPIESVLVFQKAG